MPDTPSTMFDHTVSRSLPIGVMKPIPVTATRRPLELFAMTQGYGRQGLLNMALGVKTSSIVRTRSPDWWLKELAKIQGKLQAEATCRGVEVATEEVAQLVKTVEHRVAVQVECCGGILHRPGPQVCLQSLPQLFAIAGLAVEQCTEAVDDEAFGKTRVLRQDELRYDLVMPVHDSFGPQLAPDLDRLLGLEVRS